MKLKTRLLALLLTAAVMTSVFAGCKPRDTAESSATEERSRPEVSEQDTHGKTVATIAPDFVELIAEKKEINSDTVGWLEVPGTNISDVVVQKADDKTNNHYLRLDFNQNKHFNGVYYADYRDVFGDGSVDQLGSNICIYGHAIVDNPEDDRYNIKFGQLHDFRDEELAREMPYMYFSTEKENLVYEIIAVFVANANEVPYNHGDMSQADFAKLVRDEIMPRSLYTYDTEIKDDDRFLTLSTCIYKLPDSGAPTDYPKTWYRYGIMGKLVSPDTPLKKEATFTVNKKRVVDKDTYPGK